MRIFFITKVQAAYRIAGLRAPIVVRRVLPIPAANRDKLITVNSLRGWRAPNSRVGTALALSVCTEEVCMFALSAILIGVVGVIYVRRRSSRKKQTV